jgi:3-hydroxy-9,10-secoandrosta-1,3,5(10)-triene-9,17-dione monooxygenase reductase component
LDGTGSIRAFREALGRFASGVVIVTGLDGDEPVGLTCQSFFSVSLEPPLIAIAVGKSSASWPRIVRGGAFCVNILSHHQEDVCRAFAMSGTQKFDATSWHPGPLGLPRLDGTLAWIDCQVDKVVEAGDHEIILGEVQHLTAEEGSPLLFFRGQFDRLASPPNVVASIA